MKISNQPPRIIDIFNQEKYPVYTDDLHATLLAPSEILRSNQSLLLNGSALLRNALQAYTTNPPPAIIFSAKDISVAGHGLIVDATGQRLFSHESITETGRLDHPFNANLMKMKTGDFVQNTTIEERKMNKGDYALVTQAGQGVYGHWLVDILPRIALIESTGFDGKYVFHAPIPDYGLELLKIFQLQQDRIIIFDPEREFLSFTNVLIPNSLRNRNSYSKLNQLARIRMLKNRDTTLDSKIYISRSSWNRDNQTLSNRVQLETIAVQYGFRIIFPEKLSISEQVNIYSSAKVLAGEYGSGMHNSIFSHSDCKVLVFQSEAHHFFNQAGLSNFIGQPNTIVFGTAAGKSRDFSIDPEIANYAFNLIS